MKLNLCLTALAVLFLGAIAAPTRENYAAIPLPTLRRRTNRQVLSELGCNF